MSKKNNSYKFSARNKEQSPRQQKVSLLINSAIMNYLRKGTIVDVRLIDCPLTVTKVTISADLKIANCFFLPFYTKFDKQTDIKTNARTNTKYSAEEILEALEDSNHLIRRFVTGEINMKYSPELRFYIDNGFENVIKVDELLRK